MSIESVGVGSEKTAHAVSWAVHEAWQHARALVAVGSLSQRQPGLVLENAEGLLGRLGMKSRRDGLKKQTLVLPNGSRVIGLPASEATTRGYLNAQMAMIGEADWMEDGDYRALRGRLRAT